MKIPSKIQPAFSGKVVDAEHIDGVLPVESGGTGATSLPAMKAGLLLDNVDNTRDVDKPVSIAQTAAINDAKNFVSTALDTAIAQAQTARDEALMLSSAIVRQSYAAALALVGLSDGDCVLVTAADLGTHNSIVGDYGSSGGVTPNSGYYSYSSSLSTLVRIGDLESTVVKNIKDEASIEAERTEAFSYAINTILDSMVSRTIAEGLADTEIPDGSFFPVITTAGEHFLVEKVNSTTSGTVVEYNTIISFEAAKAAVLAARDEAMAYGAAKVVASWTDAEALTGLANGAAVFVLSVDTGTHTSVTGDYGASGGVTPNSGYYLYSTALSKLVRKAPTESSIVTAMRNEAALERNLAQAYSTALATLFDGFIYRTTAEGLTDPQVPNNTFFPVITTAGDHYAVYKDNTGAAGQTIVYATLKTVTDYLAPITGAGLIGYSFGGSYTANTVGKELQNLGYVIKYTYTDATGGTMTFENGATKHARSTGEVSFRVAHLASSVNYINITPATTTNAPALAALGTDANINFRVEAKGTGFFASYGDGAKFYNSAGNQLFNVGSIASAANYVSVNPNTAGNAPSVSAAGSDTNINLQLVAKGSGNVSILGSGTRILNAAGGQLVDIPNVASPVNYPSLVAAAAGSSPGITAAGSDTNINLQLTSKGTGYVATFGAGARVFTAAGAQLLDVPDIATPVNYLSLSASATGTALGIVAAGTDANISIRLTPKGSGGVILNLANVPNYADDTAASAGGVPLGGVYRNGSILMIRAV